MKSVDLERIRTLLDEGDTELLVTLVGIYAQETPEKIERLQSAIDRADARQVREHAHSIKSSSLNMGANVLAASAAELEKRASGGDLSSARTLLAAIREEFGNVQAELNSLPELKAA